MSDHKLILATLICMLYFRNILILNVRKKKYINSNVYLFIIQETFVFCQNTAVERNLNKVLRKINLMSKHISKSNISK